MLELLDAAWAGPVFGDSFGMVFPEQKRRAMQDMVAIAADMKTDLMPCIQSVMPEHYRVEELEAVADEIIPKAGAFCAGLTIGEVSDAPLLSAFSGSAGRMYLGDQTIDRGDMEMLEAVELLGVEDVSESNTSPRVYAMYSAIGRIAEQVPIFAKPDDVPWVLDCFYGQVLRNEARMRRLSLGYEAAGKPAAFLESHAIDIANTLTVNAGFPSVSSSLHAIYRQHNPELPPLADVYGDKTMREVLQVCNATVRLWDELGDWEMDTGINPAKGVFTINLFNQYHPAIIDRFSTLARIQDDKRRNMLQSSFAAFHQSNDEASRHVHSVDIDSMFLEHIRGYMQAIPAETKQTFGQYIALCKRVLEIGYVNRMGDIALAGSPD